jgi:hypothetical protein
VQDLDLLEDPDLLIRQQQFQAKKLTIEDELAFYKLDDDSDIFEGFIGKKEESYSSDSIEIQDEQVVIKEEPIVVEHKKSLSSRFAEVDFNKQMKSMTHKSSLSHKQSDADDLNPSVYTSSYKHRIQELAQQITIEVQPRQPKITVIEEEPDLVIVVPQIDKLVALHKKYCTGDKTIEDL